ncbi:MAG: hypothetical protein STSR0009_03910 [Methanoregula sp.]
MIVYYKAINPGKGRVRSPAKDCPGDCEVVGYTAGGCLWIQYNIHEYPMYRSVFPAVLMV